MKRILNIHVFGRWLLKTSAVFGMISTHVFAAEQPYESTYRAIQPLPVLIENTTLLTGTGEQIENGAVLFVNGKIKAVGLQITSSEIPDDVVRIDGAGKWVTPGLIDAHSHIGVYTAPAHENSENDINELTGPNTAEVWVEHSVWAQDPQFPLALAGGVTTQMLLPGSKNIFSGRGVVIKTVPARSVLDMKFPGAPHSVKMVCGENPKSFYGSKGRAPDSRMGNIAYARAEWLKAQKYREQHDAYAEAVKDGKSATPPMRNLRMETLAEVLRGNISVQIHCYRAEDMIMQMEIAKEFNFKVTTFHHATGAYKIADKLAEHGACAAMWPEFWGFKHEAFDMVEENVVMVDRAGACAIIHTDWPVQAQRLNQEAAKVMASGNLAGYEITRAEAIAWITSKPAKALGVNDVTGTLETGKMADIVLWNGDPFSVYTRTEKVFIDGALMYDRSDKSKQPATDFEIGILDPEGERL